MKDNRTALILMVVSLLLLTAFQVFWLRKEYREQETNLFEASDLLFKQTLRSLEDSQVKQKIERAVKEKGLSQKVINEAVTVRSQAKKRNGFSVTSWKDSARSNTLILIRNDSAAPPKIFRKFGGEVTHTRFPPDSIRNLMLRRRPDSSGQFNIVVTMTSSGFPSPDSLTGLAKMITPMQSALARSPSGTVSGKSDRTIFLDLSTDTLNADTLSKAFSKQLREAGNPLEFALTRNSTDTLDTDKMLTASTGSGNTRFTVRFPEYRRYLLTKITSQILFSVFLLTLTGLAFGFIYRSLRQQRRLSGMKNDLISNITHELKTPLSTVGVALEAIQNFSVADKPEQVREYLDISRSEVDRLSTLVDNILTNAALGNHTLYMNKVPLDIAELATGVYEVWKVRFEQEGGRLDMSVSGETFMVEGDAVHLGSMLHNLLDNALKYGGEPPGTGLSVTENGGQVSISVTDNGEGIPKEYRKYVFDKFFRVPTGDRHNVKGYGLGLNYVRNIVEQHGGSVRLEQAATGGSRFVVTLNKVKE